MRRRILVVDEKTPTPDQDSGSASAFSVLRILAQNFKVTFIPANFAKQGHYTHALNRIGIRTPIDARSNSLAAVINKYAPKADIVLLYRAPLAVQIFDYVLRAAPRAKIVFHPVDLHFMRMQRQAELTGDPHQAELAQAMRATELDLVRRADATIVVSSHEADLLATLAPGAIIHHIPILRPVPGQQEQYSGWRGVLERLRSRNGAPVSNGRAGHGARRDIVFIGGFDHTPNVDAALWFAREVWPQLQQQGFGDRFIIVGSKIPDDVAALASPGIEVRGHVPDLAPLFDACRLSVAPLRYGGGIKGKVVTSLSYGVPVVATSIAAEGMGLRSGADILVADEPAEMADRILALYGDGELWQRLSANGYAAFIGKFAEPAGAAKILALFNGL